SLSKYNTFTTVSPIQIVIYVLVYSVVIYFDYYRLFTLRSSINLYPCRWPHIQLIIFSGDYDATKEQILLKGKQRFGITVDPRNVHFVFLRLRRLVEADLYPCFTLAAQTMAGFVLGFEALLKLNPSVFIDTMGYSLTLPLFRWIGGSRVATYVHYPTISHDMIDLVSRRERSYNNADLIVQNNLLSHAKLLYYRIFAFFYGLAGRAAEVVLVNGSWTSGHIKRVWHCENAKIVFPPCDVSAFLALEQVAETRFAEDKVVRVLSIGQIRPEKNHKMQLEVIRFVMKKLTERNDGTKVSSKFSMRVITMYNFIIYGDFWDFFKRFTTYGVISRTFS
ncbi:unnamed protein product, partial [Heligmosomoides polygyrus]|uniref:ALG11_N domain-containing protein n=1 Tax=Heligmosomoides polygyrus TaxID=6339 RepID=A0A183FLZ8_HELPZ